MSKQTAEHNRLIALPKGQLLVEADGSLIAQIRASRAARKDLRDWFDRLAASRPNGVLVHASLDSGGRGFEVRYERQTSEAVFLAAAIEQWRADPAISIPAILELGLFVLEVAGEMAGRGFGDALVALTTIRLVPGSPHHWRLVPLPTGGTSLADWARSEPDTWLWLTREIRRSAAQGLIRRTFLARPCTRRLPGRSSPRD